MKDPNNTMTTAPIADPNIQDNFTKLNALFASNFTYRSGTFTIPIINFTPSTTVSWSVNWVRIGDAITLHFGYVYPTTATKDGTSNPTTPSPIPAIILPRATIFVPFWVQNNSATQLAILDVATTGILTWQYQWTASDPAALYPNSVTYLGN